MRVFILYSTTEGHTRRLAQFAATRLTELLHEAPVHDAAQSAELGVAGFDAALLLASVHRGRFRRSFTAFARENHDALSGMPSALVSVSLSAAGREPSDMAGLRACVERLERDTLWHPVATCHVAGAMPFSRYGFFMKLVMRSIARKRGHLVDTSKDYDLTDYAAFEEFIDRFAASALAATREAMAAAP